MVGYSHEDQAMKTKLVRDPLSGQVIAVPASKVLVGPVEPGMARTTSPGMRPMSGSAAMLDLYSRLPNADIAGARGPGVTPGGEQGRGARRGQVEQEGQAAPPHTYRPLGGAKQNARGGSAILSPPDVGLGATFAEASTIVQTPRDAGDDAEVITVSLGLDFANAAEDTAIDDQLDCICTVQWGIGGVIFSAELDWIQGLVFSLPASFMNIGARYEGNQLAGAAPPPLLFSAAFAYGTQSKGTVSQTRRTIFFGQLNGGVSTIFRAPKYADGFSVFTRSTTPDLLVEVLRQTSGAVAAIAGYLYNDASNVAVQQPYMFSLPNIGRSVRVTNNGAATDVGIIWNLAL